MTTDAAAMFVAIRWLVDGAGITFHRADDGQWWFRFADDEYGHPVSPDDVRLVQLVASIVGDSRCHQKHVRP